MSQWTARIEDHAAIQRASQVLQQLDNLTDALPDDAAVLGSYERLRTVVRAVHERFDKMDPALVHPNALASVDQHLQQVANELSAFTSDKAPQRLENANSYADNLLSVIHLVPTPLNDADIEGLRDSVTSYRRTAGQLIRNLQDEASAARNKLQDLQGKIAEVNQEIGSQKARLDTAINQFQQQSAAAEEKRRTDFAEEQKQRTDAVQEAYEQHESASGAQLRQQQQDWRDALNASKADFQQLRDSIEESAGKLAASLEEQQAIAEKIVGIISNTGMAGGYQRVANEERAHAKLWRLIAVGAMTGLIIFALLAFAYTLDTSFAWPGFAGRVFATLTFGVLAAYAAKQADEHLRVERNNRRVELEIASIDPYLASLPEEHRFDVKRKLAERHFGRYEPSHASPTDPTSGTLKDVIKLILENWPEKK